MLRYQIFTLASVDYFEVGMLEFSTQQAYRVLATLQRTVICNQKKKNNIRLQRIYMTLRNDKNTPESLETLELRENWKQVDSDRWLCGDKIK